MNIRGMYLAAGIVAVLGIIGLPCSPTGGAPGEEQGVTKINSEDGALLSPDSDAYALLTKELKESGWPAEVAAHHAARMLGIIGADEREPEWKVEDLPKGGALLSPDSSAYAVLTRLFMEGGWPMDQAVMHAARKLGYVDSNAAGGGVQCYLSLTKVYYCKLVHGEWMKMREEFWMNGLCYDGPNGNDGLGHCYGLVAECLDNHDVKWVKLEGKQSPSGNCPGAPLGDCLWVAAGPPQYAPCPPQTTACSCFVQLGSGPVNCDGLEIVCAPGKTGPEFTCPIENCK